MWRCMGASKTLPPLALLPPELPPPQDPWTSAGLDPPGQRLTGPLSRVSGSNPMERLP